MLRSKSKSLLTATVLTLSVMYNYCFAQTQEAFTMTQVQVTDKWDKTFSLSSNVSHQKVLFHNRFGITLVGDLYIPKNAKGKMAAIAISGPYGAVKEQASGFYAHTLAQKGFITLAFDPSFTGESSGTPRYVSSPDINTDDFSAAIDYLLTRDDVDANKVGILGICGFGGFALNAASIDTRIKATVTSTMYDMTRVSAFGYNDTINAQQRYKIKQDLNNQRTQDYKNGTYTLQAGLPDKVDENTPQFVKDYFDYYKTKRGYHERSLGSNQGWTITNSLSLINDKILNFADEIVNPVLMIHGSKAHSLYFSQDAYKLLKGDNKKLLIVEGANHTDLYDNKDKIPFDKIVDFYNSSFNTVKE